MVKQRDEDLQRCLTRKHELQQQIGAILREKSSENFKLQDHLKAKDERIEKLVKEKSAYEAKLKMLLKNGCDDAALLVVLITQHPSIVTGNLLCVLSTYVTDLHIYCDWYIGWPFFLPPYNQFRKQPGGSADVESAPQAV